MTDLVMPNPEDSPRVNPLRRDQVNAYVRSEYDKSIQTWGIPNNLIRTMSKLPGLGLTEVDYANSFIFDQGTFIHWPDPSDSSKEVVFPQSGFIDRVTKELLIGVVSLLNRSRYSITHHSVIGWNTVAPMLGEVKAERMFLNLVDEEGNPAFEARNDLYSNYQISALNMAVKLTGDAHEVTDSEFEQMKVLCREEASKQIQNSNVLSALSYSESDSYLDAYVDGMLVELTWCVVHFAGLLNKWFTVLKVWDETDEERDGLDFVSLYNSVIPESIKVRNNALLGRDGWGGK